MVRVKDAIGLGVCFFFCACLPKQNASINAIFSITMPFLSSFHSPCFDTKPSDKGTNEQKNKNQNRFKIVHQGTSFLNACRCVRSIALRYGWSARNNCFFFFFFFLTVFHKGNCDRAVLDDKSQIELCKFVVSNHTVLILWSHSRNAGVLFFFFFGRRTVGPPCRGAGQGAGGTGQN